MQKQAPSLGKILVMVGFALSCFGLLLFLWLAFGGPVPLKPKGYQFKVSFKEAGQLANEADVRISGVSVGKVKVITPDKASGTSKAVIQLDRAYAPIPKDTKAILRQKTLLGETYVELTPGNKSGGTVPENGSLPAGSVAPTVELDEIFRAFDQKTRDSFRVWMDQLAVAGKGRSRDISDALGNLAPFAEDTTALLKLLNAQQPEVQGVVRDSGEVFAALSERDGQLQSLITNSNKVFATTAARELSPTLADLSALAPDLKALFRDLNPLFDASVKCLPATTRFLDELHPVLGELDPPLRQLNPLLTYVGGYKKELNTFFANVTASTQATSVEGNSRVHYLRTTNPVNPENLAVYPTRIGTNRPNPYQFPSAFSKLSEGLLSYETRQCGRGDPTIVTDPVPGSGLPDPLSLIPQALSDNVQKFFFATTSGGQVAAPPCKQQGKFTQSGETTQFPHVAAATGATARTK